MRREVADDHLVAIGASARSKNFSTAVAYLFEAVKSQEPTRVSVVAVAASEFWHFQGQAGDGWPMPSLPRQMLYFSDPLLYFIDMWSDVV